MGTRGLDVFSFRHEKTNKAAILRSTTYTQSELRLDTRNSLHPGFESKRRGGKGHQRRDKKSRKTASKHASFEDGAGTLSEARINPNLCLPQLKTPTTVCKATRNPQLPLLVLSSRGGGGGNQYRQRQHQQGGQRHQPRPSLQLRLRPLEINSSLAQLWRDARRK